MRIAVVPAGTRTSAATIRALLNKGSGAHQIYGLYRDLSKVPEEFTSNDNFHAVRGDIEDAASLDLAGADAVMTITPPFFDGADPLSKTKTVSMNVKSAIERAGTVRRLMLLSSLGAEFDHDVGEIKTNHVAEQVLCTTDVPEILFVRCAYFMENWLLFSRPTLEAPEPSFKSLVTPLDFEIPMVAVADIGATFAQGLTSSYTPPTKPYVFALHGPKEYSPVDVQAAFSSALGKSVKVQGIEKDELAEFFGSFLPPSLVSGWVEMSVSFLPGGVAAPGAPGVEKLNIVRGKIELNEAIGEAIGTE